jgi:hypothetical protein
MPTLEQTQGKTAMKRLFLIALMTGMMIVSAQAANVGGGVNKHKHDQASGGIVSVHRGLLVSRVRAGNGCSTSRGCTSHLPNGDTQRTHRQTHKRWIQGGTGAPAIYDRWGGDRRSVSKPTHNSTERR